MARTLAEAVSREELQSVEEDAAWRDLRERVEQLKREGPPVNKTAERLGRIEADMATVKQELATIRQAVLSMVEQAPREED